MNNVLKNFNNRKLKDLESIEQCLYCPPPRIGTDCNTLIRESDKKMNLCKSFIYYYRLLELSSINLKKHKDDKDTIENINEMIKEYYDYYQVIVEKVKSSDYA